MRRCAARRVWHRVKGCKCSGGLVIRHRRASEPLYAGQRIRVYCAGDRERPAHLPHARRARAKGRHKRFEYFLGLRAGAPAEESRGHAAPEKRGPAKQTRQQKDGAPTKVSCIRTKGFIEGSLRQDTTRRLHAGNAASGTTQSSIRSGRVKTQYNTGTARGRVFNRHRRTDLRRGFADDSEAEARAHMAAP